MAALRPLIATGDRYPELFFAGGAGKAGLYLNRSSMGGAIRFAEKPDSALALDAVSGAYPLDIDGDGLTDLALLRVGENKLFKGKGDCVFEEANALWSFEGGKAWSTAFAALWEKGSDLPTLAIGNYVDRDQPGAPFGTCHDTDFYRPNDEGGYRHQALQPGYCSLSMMFSDWGRTGKPDLRISNDRQYYRGGHEQLWKIRPGEEPVEYRSGDGWRRLRVWGMGIAATDLTGDGRPDYYLTSMADNKLQVLASRDGSPDFQDAAFERGITAHRPFVGDNVNPSTSWHAQFDDINNDSFIDLFVTKGNVEAMTDFLHARPPTACCLAHRMAPLRKRRTKRACSAFIVGGAGLWWISTWMACSMRLLSIGKSLPRSGAIWGNRDIRQGLGKPHLWAIGWPCRLSRTGRTGMLLGLSWKCGLPTGPRAGRLPSGAAMQGARPPGTILASVLPSGRLPGCNGPMGNGAAGSGSLPTSMPASAGGGRRPMSGCPRRQRCSSKSGLFRII